MTRGRLGVTAILLLLGALAIPAACGGTEVVEKIVERTVIVEKPVQQTVVVEKEKVVQQTVEVTKVVQQTVVVQQTTVVEKEKLVVATATPIPTPTPIPIVPLQPAPSPKNPVGTLVVAVFDVGPGVGLGSAQAPVETMQYVGIGEGLFNVDDNGTIVNKLAESYEVASDLSKVTIKIREGVIFHKDWGPFSAADVVFTMNDGNAAINKTSIHGQAGDFAALFGAAKLIDTKTVEIPFTSYDLRWNAHFLNEQAQSTPFFPKKLYDEKGADAMRDGVPISTGSFQVKEWLQDNRFVVEGVPYKHWFKNPEIKTLTFVEVPESASRVAMLRTGEADIATSIPLKDIRPLAQSGFKAESITRRGTIHQVIFDGNYWEEKHARTGEVLKREGYCVADLPWVSCANQAGDFEEARNVRWALAMAIDRDLLVETVLDGFGTFGAIEYVDTTAPYFKSKWKIPYDTAKAKASMEKTTWKDAAFDIGIWTGGELGGAGGTNAEINDAVAGMWKGLWPKMRVQVFKSAYAVLRPSLVGRTNTIPYAGDCDEGATTIPFDWPHGLTETSLTRGGFGCGIEIPKIAETYLKVAKETDIAKRTALNEALIDYLTEEMIFAGTIQAPDLTVYNPKSIAKWPGKPCIFCAQNEYEFIVPASR